MDVLNTKFSLTFKLININQPACLNDLISLQPSRSTRSSSVVTLARPSTRSTLQITDRSFRYASPCLWNQLADSFRQPRPHLSLLIYNFFLIISAYQFHPHHSDHSILDSKHFFSIFFSSVDHWYPASDFTDYFTVHRLSFLKVFSFVFSFFLFSLIYFLVFFVSLSLPNCFLVNRFRLSVCYKNC